MVNNKDLLERTLRFSEEGILAISKLPRNSVNEVLGRQAVRSITSVGANYREACEAESALDFVHKIRVSKKEARESEYWLILIERFNPGVQMKIARLILEARELIKILSAITKKFKK